MILRSPHRSVGHIGNRVILLCFRWVVLGQLLSGLPGYAAALASLAEPSKAKRPEHWAYVRPNRPTAPEVKTASWGRSDIDRFILARLEKTGLSPNREADRYTLIRRLSLDLIGLPPSLDEVDAFVADRGPDAYERLVDRLLASPHFGERFALAWLDQARYADTSGYHFDGFRQMHLWRDWVISAFNRNQPFDQFTIEQLAGDLLPNPTLDQKIATGFHRNVMTTDEGGVDPAEYLAKYCVDRVSTTAQVWLGTTLGCAECHDHKYDPLSTREFYQFYAFFHNVPENGLDGTRTRNPGPVLKVPSSDQGSRLLKYLDLIPVAERTVADRERELPKKQEQWETSLKATPESELSLPDLALRFPFDGSSEGIAAAVARTASTRSSEIRFVAGRLGSAIQLSGGTNDFLDAGAAIEFESDQAFSYGAWIQLQSLSGTVFSKMEPAPSFRGFDLLLSDGRIEAHLVNRFPENALKVSSKERLSTNVWHHVLLTYDGSKKAAGVRIYLNGRSTALDIPHDSLSGSITNTTPLLIGTRVGMLAFTGKLDDLRFYRRALKVEEVAALHGQALERIGRIPTADRTAEQSEDLKRFFRERRATEFLRAGERLAALGREKQELLSQIPDTMVMEEMETPRDTFIFLRGSYLNRGEKVSAGTPACWPPLPADQPTNRLALARWIASTNNPLTARVTVNRYWGMFFGTGLVKTGNDFGSQGDRPSHPELLDWLACEFMQPRVGVAQAWDIKHLVRLLVTSASYRQSADVTPLKLEKDPYNRLLARGPRVRLDAELIRDNALAISGLIDPRIGGPSVKPYQPPGIWDGTDHRYEQSHGQDLYRRGMYILWKRAAHYPSFQTFDAPSRETCTLSRPRTSTPLQSLVLMNDPVYVESARALAARTLTEGGATLKQQLTHAFRLTLARPPEAKEIKVLEQTYRVQREQFLHEPRAAEKLLNIGESPHPQALNSVDLAAMTAVANVLLNLSETLTK